MNHDRKERLVSLLTRAKQGDLTAIDDALELLGSWPEAKSVFDGVHLIADMLEERGEDPAPLADLAVLAANACECGAPAAAMLKAVGWEEPEGVFPFMRLTQRVATKLAGPDRIPLVACEFIVRVPAKVPRDEGERRKWRARRLAAEVHVNAAATAIGFTWAAKACPLPVPEDAPAVTTRPARTADSASQMEVLSGNGFLVRVGSNPFLVRATRFTCPRCSWVGSAPVPGWSQTLPACPTCGWVWGASADQQPPWEGGEVDRD